MLEFITTPLMGFYFICAIFGGTMMVLQLMMMVFGVGGDMDADGGGDTGDTGDMDGGGDDLGDDGGSDHAESHSASNDIFKMLSVRTVMAGFAFFGLGGMAGLLATENQALSLLFALGAGLVAIYVVYYIYSSMVRLRSDGSISEKTLVGATGNVYIRIPAEGAGAGKVLVTQQERTMEYEAITSGPELKSGLPIVVVRVVSPTTVEVRLND